MEDLQRRWRVKMKKEYHDPFAQAESIETIEPEKTEQKKKIGVRWKAKPTKTNKELWAEYRKNKQKK